MTSFPVIVTDLSSLLVQLCQLLLMFDSYLSHFLLQGVAATQVTARAETRHRDTSNTRHPWTTPGDVGWRFPHLGSCPLCTSYLSVWYLSDRTACRSDFSSRRLSKTTHTHTVTVGEIGRLSEKTQQPAW